MITKEGLTFNDEKLEGFSAKCDQCNSVNVNIEHVFNYYGGITGYDQSLNIKCRDCRNIEFLTI